MFCSKMADADGEGSETQVWIDFSFDCSYINKEVKERLIQQYEEVGRMLGGMIAHPERFNK
jgi:four helix bundle protein